MSLLRPHSLAWVATLSAFLCLSVVSASAQASDGPKSARDYFELGVATDRPDGDLVAAVAAYREAIKLDAKYLDAHMRLGTALMRLRKFEEAVSAFQTAAKLKPDAAGIHINLAQALFSTGNDFAALDEVKEAVRLDPQVDGADVALGSIYAKMGRFDDAQTALLRAVQRRENDPALHFQLGVIYAARKWWDQAINSFSRVVSIAPDFPEAYKMLAASYGESGHTAESIEALRIAIRQDANDWTLFFALGRLLRDLGDRDAALAAFIRAKELRSSPETALNIGELLALKGDHEHALPNLLAAVQGMPNVREPLSVLANTYLNLGRREEALDPLRKLVALQPGDPDALAILGTTYTLTGHFDEAIATLSEATRLRPGDEQIQQRLEVAIGRKELLNHLPDYRRAVTANPKSAEAHAELADTLYALTRYDEAEAEYLEALRLDPDNWSYENRLAVNYAEARQREKAVVYYQRAADHHPNHVILFSLGNSLERLGRLDEAIVAYRKSIELKPTFTMSLYQLGMIYFHLGRLPESIDMLRRVLQAEPANGFALHSLGQAYFATGDKTAAMQQYHVLKNLDPGKAADLLRIISR